MIKFMFLLSTLSETTTQEYYQPGPLGLADGRVEDAQMTASSSYGSARPPEDGRLNGSNYWAVSNADAPVQHWIQVDLLTPKVVTGIQTQGAEKYGQWVKTLKIKYGYDTTQLTPILVSGSDKVILRFVLNIPKQVTEKKYSNPVVRLNVSQKTF